MNATNMLSANKVKLHGMTSSKWTTKDKITQYKGLIKLYTRDKKIIEVDTNVADKKQNKVLKKIQKEIEQNRKDLDNAIRGDKQKLRNTLAEHREMQLAYQDSQPEKVIDMVSQVNFNKRKSRDLLLYKLKQKTQELIDFKLHYAELEDILKLEGVNWQNMLPEEQRAHIITGKVQDAILRKEAAIAVRHAYKKIIAIMKKDALYFDAILDAIRNDGESQGKCMINATKLGQLATEYLDDRRQEFQVLEKVVKRDMGKRKADLEHVRAKVESFALNIKNLLRRDSDINLCRVELPPSESFTNLKYDMEKIETTLKYLKDAIFVPNLESIYPCLQEQTRQKTRLIEMVKKCEEDRDELLKKANHAAEVRSHLEFTMVETTVQYKTGKKENLEHIEEQKLRIHHLNQLIYNRHNLLAKVRISLKHLQLLAKLLAVSKPSDAVRLRFEAIRKPSVDEIEGPKIVPELTKKFAKLAQGFKDRLSESERDEGYKMFEIMMHNRTKSKDVETIISEESLVEAVFLDSHVLTRDDIKKQSEEIVAANSMDDEFAPVDSKKKKRFKF